MQIVTPDDTLPKKLKKSIFLAGPSLRGNDDDTTPWRKDACRILREKGYNGVVFIPEPYAGDYDKQVEWENQCLEMSDCIIFWVPRSIDLPGFTTNIEYGEWMKSGKTVLGYPLNAEKMRYLETKAKKFSIPVSNSLEATIKNALSFIDKGADRKGKECLIPAYIWNTQSFQGWYGNLKEAGNKLEDARLLWNYRVGKNNDIVFAWVLQVDIFLPKEKRSKTNEFVFGRTDIGCVAAFCPKEPISETRVLLIKEFRSPVSNQEGYVYELPGGSSKKNEEDFLKVAIDELREETGLDLPKSRFGPLQVRQIASTLSVHRSHLTSVILTDKEMDKLEKEEGKARGIAKDSERTYIAVKKVADIITDPCIDWSMLGMIMSALLQPGSSMDSSKEASDWVGNFIR